MRATSIFAHSSPPACPRPLRAPRSSQTRTHHPCFAGGHRATVATRHCFGIKADVKDNICYLDEQNVIYPAGHNIVIFNAEQKTQKFIPGTDNTEGITAMAVSPNHKYVAVAERAKEGEKAQVTVFDLHTLKRRKASRCPSSLCPRGASPPPPPICSSPTRYCSPCCHALPAHPALLPGLRPASRRGCVSPRCSKRSLRTCSRASL